MDIRGKIIGAVQGMWEGLPWLNERLAELEQYVEKQSEAECTKRLVEVLMDISSFASPLSALVGVVEGSVETCEDRVVNLKEWVKGECKPIHILNKGGGREGNMLITMSVQSLTDPKFVAVKWAVIPISMATWTLCAM